MNNINGIVLTGRPGCGKSTLGKELASKLDMIYVSSGAIARKIALIDQATKDNLNKGELADEEKMRLMVRRALHRINANGGEFILDGFPRFENQWIWLKTLFPNTIMFHLNASQEQCLQRLAQRGREDDTSEIIANRMKYYDDNTLPMVKTYADHIIGSKTTYGRRLDIIDILEAKYDVDCSQLREV